MSSLFCTLFLQGGVQCGLAFKMSLGQRPETQRIRPPIGAVRG